MRERVGKCAATRWGVKRAGVIVRTKASRSYAADWSSDPELQHQPTPVSAAERTLWSTADRPSQDPPGLKLASRDRASAGNSPALHFRTFSTTRTIR